MLDEYSIMAADRKNEDSFVCYVQTEKIPGYVHPNMHGGLLFKLQLDREHAALLKLKFNFKVFSKSANPAQ